MNSDHCTRKKRKAVAKVSLKQSNDKIHTKAFIEPEKKRKRQQTVMKLACAGFRVAM